MILSAVGVFLLTWIAAVAAWAVITRVSGSSDANKVRERLLGTQKNETTAARVALFESDATPRGKLIPRLLERYDLGNTLRTLAEQAGVKADPANIVQTSAMLLLGGCGVSWMLLPAGMKAIGFIASLAASFVPILLLKRKKAKRLRAFEEVFPEALEFIARSMRAGHAFSVSLEMIHREFPEPLSGEFRRTFEEHNLGLPLDVALLGFSRRVPLLDVQFFVSAVLLQKRTGGNLAEILDKLAYVIRERFKLRGRIRAVSAHGKMTGLALSSIPGGVAVLMFFVTPEYVTFFLHDETGHMMAAVAIVMQLIGYLIIHKIVTIEV